MGLPTPNAQQCRSTVNNAPNAWPMLPYGSIAFRDLTVGESTFTAQEAARVRAGGATDGGPPQQESTS